MADWGSDMSVHTALRVQLFAGPMVWNPLPDEVRNLDSFDSFKRLLKQFALAATSVTSARDALYKPSGQQILAVPILHCILYVQFLAVIYSAFLTMEKDKLRKLLIHQRKACRSAFKLLVTSQVLNVCCHK